MLIIYHAISGTAFPFQGVTLPVQGSKGAVASESAICSQIGIDLIARGGNAADAMVGTTLCVGVIGMYHSGIGGGGFILIRDADGNYESIDYRETAPAAAYEEMYQGNILGSLLGGLAAGVPGELRGLEYLHNKYGALPWRAVVNPAIHVARDGFEVSEDLVRYMDAGASNPPGNFLVEDPVWAEDFAPNGTLLKRGDTITRKRYADTLEKVAKYGADAFYQGEIAESIVKAIQDTNGTMTLYDLKNYKALIKRPISIDFRGKKLYTTSAPSSGSVMLSILKTMEQYDPDNIQDVNLTTHRFGEAMRFAYGARLELGDPDFVSNIELYEDVMLSKRKAKEIRNRIIDNSTQPIEEYNPKAIHAVEDHGTSHIVAADAAGMVVTSTTTINTLFGSQVMTPDTGIILNNEMNDFSIPGVRNEFGFVPTAANYIRPNKRPLSSITPIIAEHANGTVFFTTGAAGGSRIISATTQVAWHVLEHGMTMAEAIAAPRLHDQLMPNQVTFEYTYDNGTVESMVEKGHNVTWVRLGVSAVQGIRMLWNGSFEAASEMRQKNSGGRSI